MITFNNVSKVYGTRVYALIDVNLKISKGQFFFVTGQSGAGKSTLLKLIYGFEKPTSGNITIGNININNLNDRKIALLRRQMGIVFQDFKLLWDRNVKENIELPLNIWGKSKSEINQTSEKIMKELDLWKYRDIMPYQLSGGEQQKVSIARAIVGDPWILIADEPTGNLDPKSTDEIFDIFLRLSQKGTSILFATHNERLIKKHSGSSLNLYKGKINDVNL